MRIRMEIGVARIYDNLKVKFYRCGNFFRCCLGIKKGKVGNGPSVRVDYSRVGLVFN